MPRVKKTTTTKSSRKVKSAKPRAQKLERVKKVKKSPVKNNVQFEQEFQRAIESLGKFWTKRTQELTKGMAAIEKKLDKATKKQKSAKAISDRATQKAKAHRSPATKNLAAKARDNFAASQETVAALQHAFASAKQALDEAKASINKNAALSKVISRFEQDWAKQAKAAILASKRDKKRAADKSKALKGEKQEKVGAKRGRKAKVTDSTPVVSAPKKRGRKPKQAVIAEEDFLQADETVHTLPEELTSAQEAFFFGEEEFEGFESGSEAPEFFEETEVEAVTEEE